MRRHVQSMWRSGSNLGVAAGSGKSLLGQLWFVVSVDQIMSHTGMIGLILEQLLEYPPGFFPVGKCAVIVWL